MWGFGSVNVLLCGVAFGLQFGCNSKKCSLHSGGKRSRICGVIAWNCRGYGGFITCSIYLHLNHNEIKEVPRVLKTELEVETIGEPSVQALPEAEQRLFFETLLARIKEQKENQDD